VGEYVEQGLSQGEAVRYTARLSLWKYPWHFLIGAALALTGVVKSLASLNHSDAGGGGTVFFLGLLLVGAGVFLWPLLARRSTELVITDRRLIVKYGVISTQSIEIRFDKIETVRVSQGLVGRLLNYGDVVVTGTGSTFDPIGGIADALRFRAALNEAMERSGRAAGGSRMA
jgi:uncharacterized membrane protein YdbT with pleckstrin-like domain